MTYRAGRSVYNTQRWRELSKATRKARPYCEHCGKSGKGHRLYVDHIIELRDGGAPYDPANLAVLCASCHSTKTHWVRGWREFQARGGKQQANAIPPPPAQGQRKEIAPAPKPIESYAQNLIEQMRGKNNAH